ncbi:hypothetical protein [Streptomyces sp. NPDC001020]
MPDSSGAGVSSGGVAGAWLVYGGSSASFPGSESGRPGRLRPSPARLPARDRSGEGWAEETEAEGRARASECGRAGAPEAVCPGEDARAGVGGAVCAGGREGAADGGADGGADEGALYIGRMTYVG